ncbi:RING finger protein 112-like [Mixophyes fleayi]|uniref:RING finger protein 112-like n=1 Tax=Mixophyes fleayi TaxID=3061075 RepID=UPI003F4DE343
MGSSNTKPATMPQEGAAGFSKLEEDITCSVCLQELTEPVSITCGHTFCRACITSYWATTQPQGYRCPECRKICPKDQLIPAYRLKHLVTKVQLVVKEEKDKQEKMAPVSAVQLVYTDAQGQLHLDESTVQRCFLDSEIADYPLCLICVIGEKRRGKTTLMNYILRALHSQEKGEPVSLGERYEPLKGFEWSPGTDSVTKGIWMWNRPFILEKNRQKMAVFVLDTEGSLDIESDRETCIKLSALSMLLSSYLIFNVISNLKTTELDYLEMYLHISELTGQSFSLQHLQHLDLLVRDWQDPNNCGREAARTYIEHEMERLRKSSKYRQVLQTLRSPSVNGFLLPHPGKEFLRSTQGRLADMDCDFRSHLTRYISDLVGGIWQHCKTDIRGEQITCAHLGGTLKEFVSILQKQQYGFASPIEMFYSLENHQNKKIVIKRFQDFMDNEAPIAASLFKILKVTPTKLRSKVEAEVSNLVNEYKDLLKGDNKHEKEELMDEMKSLLMQEQEKFCAEYSKRFTKCAIGIGCAVGGGVLSLAGGIVGAAVAGTVLAVEAAALLGSTTAAVVTGAVGGSVTLGAIGTGVGAGVGGVIGHKENRKEEESEHGGNTGSSEDDQQLLDK